MQFLPIIERELRVGPRRPYFYRTRFMPPLMGMGVLLLFAWSVHMGAPTQMMGKQLFYMCFAGIFLGCLVSGVNWTADSISSEKREGTIGFLFLTDLKGYDVVLGKLVSSSINGIYSLIGILPVLSVVFLIGGVDWALMLKLVLASANVMFFSLSIGLLASVFSREQKNARGLTIMALLLFSVIPPTVGWLLKTYLSGAVHSSTITLCYSLSPAMAYIEAVKPTGIGWAGDYVQTLVFTQIIGWVVLGAACALLRNNWQEKTVEPAKWAKLILKGPFLRGKDHAERRAHLLNINAVHWLTHRERWKSAGVWALFGIIALGYLGFFVCNGKDALNVPYILLFIGAMNFTLKISMAGEACKWIVQDRQSGALELMLTTSMTVEDILEGQRKTLRSLYLKPFIAAAVLETCLVFAGCMSGALSGERQFGTFIFLAVSLSIIPADYIALGWVGMWKALSASPPSQARAETARAILYMPILLFYLGMIGVAVLTLGIGVALAPVIYPAIMIGNSVWWKNRAKARLLAEFRQRAAERYNPQPVHPWWTKAGRYFGRLLSQR